MCSEVKLVVKFLIFKNLFIIHDLRIDCNVETGSKPKSIILMQSRSSLGEGHKENLPLCFLFVFFHRLVKVVFRYLPFCAKKYFFNYLWSSGDTADQIFIQNRSILEIYLTFSLYTVGLWCCQYRAVHTIEVPCAKCTPCKASVSVTSLVTLWDWAYVWLWCTGPPTLPMRYAKQLKSLVEFLEFQALQTQAEQLHSADQAGIVAVTRLWCCMKRNNFNKMMRGVKEYRLELTSYSVKDSDSPGSLRAMNEQRRGGEQWWTEDSSLRTI